MAKMKLEGLALSKIKALASGNVVQKALEIPLKQAMELEASAIVKRTERGSDVDGRAFKPYSAEYRKWKSGDAKARKKAERRNAKRLAAGKRALPGRADVVNLTLSGLMLKSITSGIERASGYLIGKIYFMGIQYQKGKNPPSVVDVARWNNATRKFFGLSREQLARISRKLKAALKL